ncbi:MAG: hypothetical protein HQ594_01350 [Candidatus Omnitrophica bacterium]|nr:hypothetical protein [Candidatus Omnitrophota bacterium]
MYCPKCRTEYRDGFDRCADCDVVLVHELPRESRDAGPEEKEAVKEGAGKTLGMYATHAEAEIITGFLKSCGIEAIVSQSKYKGWAPYGSSFKRGIPVVVLEEDLEKAKELIESMPYDESEEM